MPTVDERLNDTTPWTLADISRELHASPRFVAQWALRSLSGYPANDRVLPFRNPGAEAPGLWCRLSVLIRAAEGEGDGPCWPAGTILWWARSVGRVDHNLTPVRIKPPSPEVIARSRRAAARLSAELSANAPAISAVLSAPDDGDA